MLITVAAVALCHRRNKSLSLEGKGDRASGECGYIAEIKPVIELDGSQHYEEKEKAVRAAFLTEQGLTVLRIPNNRIQENFQGICEHLYNLLQKE